MLYHHQLYLKVILLRHQTAFKLTNWKAGSQIGKFMPISKKGSKFFLVGTYYLLVLFKAFCILASHAQASFLLFAILVGLISALFVFRPEKYAKHFRLDLNKRYGGFCRHDALITLRPKNATSGKS